MTAVLDAPQVVRRSMFVRPATAEDADWIVRELRRFGALVARRCSFFDEAHLRAWLPRLIDEHFVRIAERGDGERAGVVIGLVAPHPLNPRLRVLSEVVWWVAEAHRATRAGLLLLDAFVAYGRAHADCVLLALEADSPVRDATLARRGFVLKERAFILEV